VVDPSQKLDSITTIHVKDGNIASSAKEMSDKSDEAEIIDLTGKVVIPGLIDMHVHLREPGYEHKETIETGIHSAIHGGFTAVCCMPNTNPAIDDESVVRYIYERSRLIQNGIVEVYPIAAATKGREGRELAPIAELVQAGAVGFSDDGSPIGNADKMRRVLEYSSMFNRPIIQHAEERSLSHNGVMNEGFQSTRLGLPGIPREAEHVIIARDIILMQGIRNARYHVAHISTKEAVEEVRRAKSRGLQVTCEVTPHHFTLTDDAVEGYDTNTKMHPPLRTADDVQAIKEGLKDGTIDVVATDHAPHTIDEKDVEFLTAPFGIVGLETSLGLVCTELLHTGVLTLNRMIEIMSINPRRILDLPPVQIKVGERASFSIVDLEAEWKVDIHAFKSKSFNSPFHQRALKGRPFAILNNGMFERCF